MNGKINGKAIDKNIHAATPTATQSTNAKCSKIFHSICGKDLGVKYSFVQLFI